MTDQHPITPPPELVQQWLAEGHHQDYCSATEHAIAQAARWGADQELEACCEWISTHTTWDANRLHTARRPKQQSLKEQGLKALDSFEGFTGSLEEVDIIRRALEQLND